MRFYALIFSTLLPSVAFAGFGVAKGASAPPPDDGYAEVPQYQDAANHQSILTPAEKRDMERYLSTSINHTYYLRGMYTAGQSKVNSFSQRPSSTYPNVPSGGTSTTVEQTSVSHSLSLWSVAWGYKATDWRYEGEFYHLSSLDYNPHPVLNTPNPTTGHYVDYNSKLKGDALFFNVYRDFPMAFYIAPYIGLGIGGSYQSMDTTATDATTGNTLQTKKNHHIEPAFNAMVGLRLRLLDEVWIDAAYRYLYVNHGARGDAADISLKAKSETVSGFAIGLDYQF